MREILIPLLIVLFVSLSSLASAYDTHNQENSQNHQSDNRQVQQHPEEQHHDWSHPAYQDSNWQRANLPSDEPFPFKWHESRNSDNRLFNSPYYRTEPIDDPEWNDRFPGLHAYRWHDNEDYSSGFWYHGQRINDAVLFFDDSDQLVSVGFMFNGTFLCIRDNQELYGNNDAALLAIISNLFQN